MVDGCYGNISAVFHILAYCQYQCMYMKCMSLKKEKKRNDGLLFRVWGPRAQTLETNVDSSLGEAGSQKDENSIVEGQPLKEEHQKPTVMCLTVIHKKLREIEGKRLTKLGHHEELNTGPKED